MKSLRFNHAYTDACYQIFQVVFFPDRIFHEEYLNATRSRRYRYDVIDVRSVYDTNVLKGRVFLDGRPISNFLRLEYGGHRLIEAAREKGRFVENEVIAHIRLLDSNNNFQAEASVKLHYDQWIAAYQVELWETLEAPENTTHSYLVLSQMGGRAPITRVRDFVPALADLPKLLRFELAYREDDREYPSGFAVAPDQVQWDNDYQRSHQVPVSEDPNSPLNTHYDGTYLITFQRGFHVVARDVQPVRYRNAMMDPDTNPDASLDNIIEMRWLLQREFGGSVVFFHEVTIPPGKIEGTHQHVGSEELYYVVSGQGIAYMGVDDDPKNEIYPTVERDIMGIGLLPCKEIPVAQGSVIYTKSGGLHGIRNDGLDPLKFVAFLQHTP